MKNALYLLVIVVGLAVIAAKLGWVEIPWLSERLVKAPAAEESAEPGEPPMPAFVEPVPEEEPKPEIAETKPDPQPAPEVAEAKSAPEPAPAPAPVEPAVPEPAPVPAPSGPVPPDEVVADLHTKYEAALASQAIEPFETGSEKLTNSYLGALEREGAAAQAAAELDALLFWRIERLRLEGKPPAGEPRGGPPVKLVEMRRLYEAETAKLSEARDVKEAELKTTYDGALAAYEKSLTQALKVDEALAVRQWREPYREVAAAETDVASPGSPAPGTSVRRLTLAEIDRGEVGNELEIVLPGGIPMVFCWCPPGKFLMGSPPDEVGRETDETQHLVELTKGYWLGKYEVTQAQWTALMETTVEEQHALVPGHDTQPWLRLIGISPDHPMYFVNWEGSEAFCTKLGRTFRLPRPWKFALPTEAQWEYACRAGTTGPYGGTGVIEEMGRTAENSGGTTHPVGQKTPNAWGLHDMHGNVWEWCAGSYEDYPRSAVIDPVLPGWGTHRVIRGGCIGSSAERCRSALRNSFFAGNRFKNVGFRVAMSSTP